MPSARSISLFVVLYATWLLLSGIWDPFLLIVGAVCCALIVVIAHRMDVVDHEGHPIGLSWRAFTYFPWLFVQILLSNINVARLILSPKLKISPAAGDVPSSQRTVAGRVTFANSITLTPGTVSLSVFEDHVFVHALTKEGLEELQQGDMNRRVSRFEGSR